MSAAPSISKPFTVHVPQNCCPRCDKPLLAQFTLTEYSCPSMSMFLHRHVDAFCGKCGAAWHAEQVMRDNLWEDEKPPELLEGPSAIGVINRINLQHGREVIPQPNPDHGGRVWANLDQDE